jgi:hypothetical protein
MMSMSAKAFRGWKESVETPGHAKLRRRNQSQKSEIRNPKIRHESSDTSASRHNPTCGQPKLTGTTVVRNDTPEPTGLQDHKTTRLPVPNPKTKPEGSSGVHSFSQQ